MLSCIRPLFLKSCCGFFKNITEMSEKIDPREVLTYLNELGYINISAQQLKEFIADLKKLIKYEHKVKASKINKENITPFSYCGNKCCNDPFCSNKKSQYGNQTKQSENDIFNSLYSQPTVASRAKEVPRQERQISVHIVRPKVKSPKHDHFDEHCVHVEKPKTEDDSRLQFVKNIELISDGSRLDVGTESTIKSIRPSSKQTVFSFTSSSKTVRPKSSIIRPAPSKSFSKCDPVALYQYYQKEWKTQKIPGQEKHSDLRWAVREKMLGGPKLDNVSRPSTCRRSNSWKG